MPGAERRVSPCSCKLLGVTLPFQIETTMPNLQSVGMIPLFQMEHNRVCNHREVAAPSALSISAQTAHPPGAYPLFSWFTARLVFFTVGGSQLTVGPPPKNPRETHDRGGVHTLQLLKVASPSGQDPRFSRQRGAISRFHCRIAAWRPRGAQRPDSSAGRSRVS